MQSSGEIREEREVRVNDRIRVQALTPWLFRIEQESPEGFEDRPTFTVLNRDFESPAPLDAVYTEDHVLVELAHASLRIPQTIKRITEIEMHSKDGGWKHRLTRRDGVLKPMPAPSNLPDYWILADSPRLVPPEWGALPPPSECEEDESGWGIVECVRDWYVFLPKAAGYDQFLRDYIQLTGPVPMPPLYAFGFWYSRYHPYSEQDALGLIDEFRERGFPLDVFVVDTDWRQGGSCGYDIDAELFPDMARFLQKCHDRGVRVVFNDHPEPVGEHALASNELAFRKQGLDSLLSKGADAWWYDRNWHTHLQSPEQGLTKEVWGMRLYHDMTAAHATNRRPLIMSNVDGIWNGRPAHPSHPAAHRYPIWWTGDTRSHWRFLQLGVKNMLNYAIESLLPYLSEDLTGHMGEPDAEYVIRFMQFGVFSPIARLHSSRNTCRYPWAYGESAERIVRDYLQLRYRLLPVIYAAAFQAWKRGLPIARRCDLLWPEFPEAADDTQYLFGDDLLVAPIIDREEGKEAARDVWLPPGPWLDVWSGTIHEGPQMVSAKPALDQIPLFVRQGAIVATLPPVLGTADVSWSQLNLFLVPPAHAGVATRRFYWDDGISNAYKEGVGEQLEVTMTRSRNQLDVVAKMMSEHSLPDVQLILWEPSDGEALAVSMNGAPVDAMRVTGGVEGPSSLFKGAADRGSGE